MKTQLTLKYNSATNSFHARLRYDYYGFIDEIVYEVRPHKEDFSVIDLMVLKDPSEQYETGTKLTVSSSQLLELIFTGGYH